MKRQPPILNRAGPTLKVWDPFCAWVFGTLSEGSIELIRSVLGGPSEFRFPVCYDWYAREYNAISKLERGRRWSAQKLFRERVERELRHAGRMALIAGHYRAGLAFWEGHAGSGAPGKTRARPRVACRQMQALLAEIKEDKNAVVLAGDLNTTSSDNTPTSIRNEIMIRVTDYKFWIGQAVSYFSSARNPQIRSFPLRYFHGYNDPTAFHLPVLWDNRERPLFRTWRGCFSDDQAFDFRGESQRTLPPRGRTLADSNQRSWKGFAPTYAFSRDFGGLVGRFKLDWVLVKPFINEPRRAGQSFRFAPHFPVTMRELNESVDDRVSDHAPLTVDLPLMEPPKTAAERGQPEHRGNL